ncbi:MAG: hypothetical protein ACI9JN_001124 [Bacteroidia bacterium]|jgi:hypothetical protein
MKKNISYGLVCFCIIVLISACKDDAASTSVDPEAQAIEQVRAQYKSSFEATEVSSFNWNGSTTNCTAGVMDVDVQSKSLERINYFRVLAGLPGNIVFKEDWNQKCMEAALMCHANGQLNHAPPANWNCYTDDGKTAAGRSNLSSSPSTRAMVSYMRDAGGNNQAAGHRRWILYSRAKTMGHGATSKYDALWVIGGSEAPDKMPEYVAWPPKYAPAPFIWPRWTFSVPGGDFINSTVTVTSDGIDIPLTIEYRNGSFGDPTIVFVPQSIDNETDGKKYVVEVSNVLLNSGETKSYKHEVTVVTVN